MRHGETFIMKCLKSIGYTSCAGGGEEEEYLQKFRDLE